MAYRIRYGKQRVIKGAMVFQMAAALGLLIAILTAGQFFPDFTVYFRGKPQYAQQVMIDAYTNGTGFRGSMVCWCGTILKQAGYGNEDNH